MFTRGRGNHQKTLAPMSGVGGGGLALFVQCRRERAPRETRHLAVHVKRLKETSHHRPRGGSFLSWETGQNQLRNIDGGRGTVITTVRRQRKRKKIRNASGTWRWATGSTGGGFKEGQIEGVLGEYRVPGRLSSWCEFLEQFLCLSPKSQVSLTSAAVEKQRAKVGVLRGFRLGLVCRRVDPCRTPQEHAQT
jgi:hypothetical protein